MADIVSNLETVKKTVRSVSQSLTRAYEKLNPAFLALYWMVFIEWCETNGLCTVTNGIEKDKVFEQQDRIKWLQRDAKTNKLPKGTNLAFYRFMFGEEIPEDREVYRNNPLYTTLDHTIHKNAEKLAGIEYHRESKAADKKAGNTSAGNAKDIVDSNNVALPTSVLESDIALKGSIAQALLSTIAWYNVQFPDAQNPLLDYARSLQVNSKDLVLLEKAQSDYIQRIKDNINAAKSAA